MGDSTLTLIEWCLKQGWSFSYNAKALSEIEAQDKEHKHPDFNTYYRLHAGKWAVTNWNLTESGAFCADTLSEAIKRMLAYWDKIVVTPSRAREIRRHKAHFMNILRGSREQHEI